jgi:hypothetical protein
MLLLWVAWSADYFYFRHAGARFTAQDGQDLCIVVRDIAKYSYGYQQLGNTLPECHYVKK